MIDLIKTSDNATKYEVKRQHQFDFDVASFLVFTSLR